ncbi:translation elongation factor 4 [Mesotoga sp.]|uniref:translation elongation factor 4 n=2 Tax=Mesotoga sp. TaxID=2053577 RepID=UPI0016A34288|nr:translation elongation factor 4 [Mesotoga sp.]MDI9368417.1 translation elongation factor 4 [Thermotogota bacterium]NLT44287.1 elongation factor 4 [Thermotogaceae bacterium]MDD3680964.1 translation elongation factor 4 [Mesotoga sp.]MDD4207438.1 translation elongation factor 4 [Mesotoga sp.]MDD5682605.1 translation elongation factor 4 [Mesotoga sp.]
MYNRDRIRNISIIAHIDHGKTTLVDRLLDITDTVDRRHKQDQFMDSMDIERERGITIKSKSVKLNYLAEDGLTYEINIIDTPGHVDFNYEVSRSLAACEGAILLVDASQGVEAQTVGNTYLAIENDLELIPVLNKIDIPNANIEETLAEIVDLIGYTPEDCLQASAKTGQGVKEILESVVRKVSAPSGTLEAPLKALIFDAIYDKYRGVVVHVRIFDGSVKEGDKIQMMASGETFEVVEVGYFLPQMEKTDSLDAGEVGYIVAVIKDVSSAKIGDTITSANNPTGEALPGYKEAKPMVYAGMFPGMPEYYDELRKALDKFKLNDAALVFEPENSPALGFGFRVGFLGLLHMDVVRERLEREFEIACILTAPNVVYRVTSQNGEIIEITNPASFPEPGEFSKVEEPFVDLSIITPSEYMGNLIGFITSEKRGDFKAVENAGKNRVVMRFEAPLSEIMFDFFDRMKAISRGYASMDYEILGYRESDLVKVTILVNKETVDSLSFIVHVDKEYQVAKKVVDKLSELIPPHQFQIPIQAKSRGRIIARSDIKALRKDVLAKCYGGDVTRKMKLLEKQKEGKKRMREIGQVTIPQNAFLAILRIGEEE